MKLRMPSKSGTFGAIISSYYETGFCVLLYFKKQILCALLYILVLKCIF